jgi:HEPN domain-containing protein
VREWLAKADEDLRAAEAILAAPMPSFGTASFHAQQAAEKALKALLVRHSIPFEKTHDLGRILAVAAVAAPGIEMRLADCEVLTPHAVLTRYPMMIPGPERGAAAGHLALARRVYADVEETLRGYLEAEPSAT